MSVRKILAKAVPRPSSLLKNPVARQDVKMPRSKSIVSAYASLEKLPITVVGCARAAFNSLLVVRRA
jgi:hypothetical protein